MKKLTQLIVLTLITQAAVAQDGNPGRSAVGLGAYYAKGDFGQDSETSIRFMPASFERDNGRWGVQLLVPRLEVEGPGTVLLNLGGISQAVASDEITVEQGLGDAVASLIYHLDPLSDTQTFLDLRLDVKLPTADEAKALGTGQADYSLQVDISRQQGAITYFGTAGYTYRGSSPVFEGLRNGEFVQLGLAYPLTQRVTLGAIYDYRAAPATFSAEIHELLPYAAFQLTENWSLSAVVTTGFTDASADVSLFGQLRYSW